MKKPDREYRALDAAEIRRMRGYCLPNLMRAPSKIPAKPGVYIWRYWPSLKDLTKDEFIQMFQEWQERQPQFFETVANSRISVSVIRTPFGGGGASDTLLGFNPNSEKAKALLAQLSNDESARQLLAYTLECIFSAAPPLYIGKADDLRARLTSHFEMHSSKLLTMIEEARIPSSDVYISYFLDPSVSSDTQSITTTLEEIVQRIANPPFTKRYG